jgi:hypothetical protein
MKPFSFLPTIHAWLIAGVATTAATESGTTATGASESPAEILRAACEGGPQPPSLELPARTIVFRAFRACAPSFLTCGRALDRSDGRDFNCSLVGCSTLSDDHWGGVQCSLGCGFGLWPRVVQEFLYPEMDVPGHVGTILRPTRAGLFRHPPRDHPPCQRTSGNAERASPRMGGPTGTATGGAAAQRASILGLRQQRA